MDVITRERYSVWIYVFISCFCTVTSIHVYGECFHKPSFVGLYSPLKANAGAQSEAVTEHGFSEIPIKVEVQVKSTRSSPGSQVVFPGIGSSQRDDDFDSPYGGVVYRYDKTSVYMYVPNRNDGFPSGTVIYTGGSTWVGSSTYNESQADVRARAWKTSDFPKPDFESDWIIIRAQNETDSYKEIPHSLGMEPEYVIVQVRHGETNMVSEGIGSSMHLHSINRQSEWGGLIYSYNKDIVRLWVPGFDGVGYVFSAADGWGDNANITVDYGYVKIRAWKIFNGNQTVSASLQYGKSTTDVRDYSFARKRVSVDDGLLSVTVKSNNSHFVYPAMGAVQNSKSSESNGGVVYSYSELALHLWHPPVSGRFDNGYITYVDTYWGSSVKTEKSKSAHLQIRAWNAYGITCPLPTTLPPASTSTPRFIPSTSMKKVTTRTTPTTSTSPSTIPTTATVTTKTITSTALTSTSSSLPSLSQVTTSTIVTNFSTSKMMVSMKRTSTSSTVPTTATSGHTPAVKSTSTTNSVHPTVSTSAAVPATTPESNSSTAPVPPEGESGGISSAAVAAIAAVASLVGIGCLSGLLFAFIKRSKEKKRKTQVEPEKGELENNQETTDEKGAVQENNDQNPDKESQDNTSTTDNGQLPEDNVTIENGQPPANTDINIP